MCSSDLLAEADCAWRVTGVDPDGLDLALGDRIARMPFPTRVVSGTALRKVLAVAPPAQTAQAAQLMDQVRLVGTGREPRPPAAPRAIQEAITARRVLRLSYADRHGVLTCREVEPVAFVGAQAHWCLVAWCRLRNGTRAFRLDRIHAAVDTGEPAPHRSYGDLDVSIPDALVRRVDLAG